MGQEIGKRIKDIRKSRGMSQATLARLAGVSQSALCDIENVTHNPSAATLSMIASALNIPVSCLVEDEQPPRVPDQMLQRQEQAILLLFRSMNDNGQQVAMDMLRSLAMNPAFQRDNKKTAIPAV